MIGKPTRTGIDISRMRATYEPIYHGLEVDLALGAAFNACLESSYCTLELD